MESNVYVNVWELLVSIIEFSVVNLIDERGVFKVLFNIDRSFFGFCPQNKTVIQEAFPFVDGIFLEILVESFLYSFL